MATETAQRIRRTAEPQLSVAQASTVSAGVTAPQLSIVVVTHNVERLLRACLRSVFASRTPFTFEVAVVDTGDDGSAAMVRVEFPQVIVIEAPENPGYAAANNLGLRRSRGAFCLLLNPDTELPDDALAAAVAALERNPNVGVLGPKLVRSDGSLDLACRRSFPTPRNALWHFLKLPKLFPRWSAVGAYNLTYKDPDQSYEVDAVSGAFLLIRRRALEEIGLLDETYWMYGEDLDLCLRSKARGWRTLYYPAVQVLHAKGQSSRTRSLRCTYEFYRAMLVFYRKHYAPRAPAVERVLVSAGIVALGAVSLLRDRVRPPSRRHVS